MKLMNGWTGLALAVGMAGAARADFIATGPFGGSLSEGFEGRGYTWQTGSIPVFSGMATMHEKSSSTLILTGSWSFRTVVRPEEGSVLMGSPSAWVEYEFMTPLTAFGGFFATNSGAAGGRVEFYSAGTLLSTQALNAPASGAWAWNGWASSLAFDAVRVIGSYGGGGFVMQDDLRVTVVPSPGVMMVLGGPGVLFLARRRSRHA